MVQLSEQTRGYLVHCLLVVLVREQMPVPVHRDLQRSMASECLNRLRRAPGFDPTRYGEVPKRMPIETPGWRGRACRVRSVDNFKVVKKRAKTAFHQIVMTDVVSLLVWKNEVFRRFEFRF
jgi:hypothetical protein